MDLSIFLILVFVTLQFVAEYFNWNQTKVKLGIFVSTVVITLPNIAFMVIDWWRSPHSKVAILVLNIFTPVLRGETYRLFRWLRSVGVDLGCDDINQLPITIVGSDSFQFYIRRECYLENLGEVNWIVVDEKDHVTFRELTKYFGQYTISTYFNAYYSRLNWILHVYQLKSSRKLHEDVKRHGAFSNQPLFKSSLMESREFKVDSSRENLLVGKTRENNEKGNAYPWTTRTQIGLSQFSCSAHP